MMNSLAVEEMRMMKTWEIKNSDIDKSYRKSQSKLQKVTCGILGCTAKPMLLQNLKDHTKAKHGKSHPKIKGQPTVSSMFLLSNQRKRVQTVVLAPEVRKEERKLRTLLI